MRTIAILPLLFLLTSCVPQKKIIKNDFVPCCHLEIKQIVLPYSNDYSFVITNGYLLIYDLKTKEHETIKKKLIKKKLTKEEMLDIVSALKKMENLKSHYTDDKWIDGIYWEIDYSLGKLCRKIVVGNMEVNEITNLFKTINKISPENKPTLIIW
jgi:NAD-dependent DNA ligase